MGEDKKQKKKILAIDDQDNFLEAIKYKLQSLGDYEVATANNGDVGIRQAKRLKPDLILLDIGMPGKDGFQVLEILKKDHDTSHIPVVMLTAVDEEEAKIKAAQLYNQGYLTKPVQMETLKAKIEQVLFAPWNP